MNLDICEDRQQMTALEILIYGRCCNIPTGVWFSDSNFLDEPSELKYGYPFIGAKTKDI